MRQHLVEKKAQERQFLDQLLNGRILQDYGIPVPINADLRKYQQVISLILNHWLLFMKELENSLGSTIILTSIAIFLIQCNV